MRKPNVEKLERNGDVTALEQLVHATDLPPGQATGALKVAAVDALQRIGSADAIWILGSAVSRRPRTPAVAHAAIAALRQIGSADAAPTLGRALVATDDFGDFEHIVAVLAEFGDPLAVRQLVRGFPSLYAKPGSQSVLERAIADQGEAAFDVLIEELERSVAAFTAVKPGDRLERTMLVAGICAIARTLGRMGDTRAVGPLLVALEAEQDLAHDIAPVLADLGDRAAVEPLRRLSDSGNLGPSRAARVALGELGGENELGYLRTFVTAPATGGLSQTLGTSFKALAAVGDPAVDTLAQLLAEGAIPPGAHPGEHETAKTTRRRLAAVALGDTGSELAVEPLCEVAVNATEADELRASAIQALARIASPRAVPVLDRIVNQEGDSSWPGREASFAIAVVRGEAVVQDDPHRYGGLT